MFVCHKGHCHLDIIFVSSIYILCKCDYVTSISQKKTQLCCEWSGWHRGRASDPNHCLLGGRPLVRCGSLPIGVIL